MKKYLFVALSAVLCISIAGCKINDYKQAVDFQNAGDYAAASELYEILGDYKDSAARFIDCEKMLSAIDYYESAITYLNDKNADLDAAISDAEDIILDHEPALDSTLAPALENAISECKKARVSAPEIPDNATGISALAEELYSIDYSCVLENLSKNVDALEISIKQYALVDAPSESYIITCLMNVPNISGISAATEENDPNGQLNKAGGYTAQVYFSSNLINQNLIYGDTIIEKGTDCGGSIEVYSTVEDAQRRNEYLASFDGTVIASGSHTVVGTVIVRTSNELTASQQKEMEANIISALISLEN